MSRNETAKSFFDLKITSTIIVSIVLILVLSYVQSTNNLEVLFNKMSRTIVDGLAFSMLLFLMVSGFYLIFGLADVINFAHGAFFMIGGFVGYELYLLIEVFVS
ncbi:MAG: ABC transporter permease subunit, partial [Candidatus Kariarchaeaceae archaeon]